MAAKKARIAVSAKVAAMSLKAKMAAGFAPTTAAVAAPKAARVDADKASPKAADTEVADEKAAQMRGEKFPRRLQ